MAVTPQIITQDVGRHNAMMDEALKRLDVSGAYKDLSTIIILPAFASVPFKPMMSWWNMILPPNQKIFKMGVMGMEVGEAYTQAVTNILAHPDLSKFKYILTIEHDNVVPADGLLKILETAEARPELAAIGGLYWTKGEEGQPQIWGDIKDPVLNFRPQRPVPGEVVECCGTAMGFTLYRLDMFKDGRLRKPWFKTAAGLTEQGGGQCYTQDLWFWEDARKHGFRCAIDCRVLVGHYAVEQDVVW